MEQYEFKVENMTCQGCAGKIRTALEEWGKVESVNVDVGTKSVIVTSNEKGEVIKEIIQSVGFNPVEKEKSQGIFGKIFRKF